MLNFTDYVVFYNIFHKFATCLAHKTLLVFGGLSLYDRRFY